MVFYDSRTLLTILDIWHKYLDKRLDFNEESRSFEVITDVNEEEYYIMRHFIYEYVRVRALAPLQGSFTMNAPALVMCVQMKGISSLLELPLSSFQDYYSSFAVSLYL